MIRSAILLCFCASISLSQQLVLGIIEQHFHDWRVDSLNAFVIRVAFKKEAREWKPFPTDFSPPQASKPFYPATMSWNICFDGRILGSLSSHTPDVIRYYKDIGIHYIDDVSKVPKIGKPGLDFSGWVGEPVHRPLVVCTSPFCADKDKWKPYKPTQADVSAVLEFVRTNFTKSVSSLLAGKYRIEKSYLSRRNKLVCISFDDEVPIPVDTSNIFESESGTNSLAWFLLGDSSCVYLRSNMLLLDAGDYDNDGKVEVVFKFEEYDHDGYIFYYEDFRRMSEFGWIYH